MNFYCSIYAVTCLLAGTINHGVCGGACHVGCPFSQSRIGEVYE